MARLNCPHCKAALSIDESKLPMQPVNIPCPTCREKFVVDRRTLAGSAPPAAPAEPIVAAPPVAPPPASAAPHAPSEEYHEDEQHQLGEKALIVGVDSPAIRQAAKTQHLQPVYFGGAEQARDYLLRESTPVVFLNPVQLTAPPLADMSAITSVAPVDRRRAFFILVADNLRTLDGNAAFLYGVNLVVAVKDLPSFPQIYREANAFHERLYTALNAAYH